MSALTLNRLRPGPCEETEAASLYAYPSDSRSHLRVNMVSSIDGAATLEGRVGTLTGPSDQRLLLLLRALADVLIVGAGTIRAEGYGPLTVAPGLMPLREQAGQGPAPRLVVPTRSLDLDLGSAAFTEAVEPPLVVTTGRATPDRVRQAEAVAEVVVLGDDAVDLTAMVALLLDRGARRLLCEGGPGLLAGLLAEDLVDEVCLALAPVTTCGSETRITAGPALTEPQRLRLAQVAERDDYLFLRYTRP
ncbi:MAG TPA: pyrimidine reductase family protein [Nocardioidaceae bacterium]|nr:pyrimidine reductase family protein [Nocardioidaceae bacterium]